MLNNKKNIITQIGSLPYNNVNDAVNYSLQHDIPFLPELLNLGEAAMQYINNPGKMSCLDEFSKRTKGLDIVKVQCIGPATLVLTGKYDADEAVKRVYEHIEGIIRKLKAKNIILFLDEPALDQAGFNYKDLWKPIFNSFSVIPGVHTCGNMNWDELFDSNLEIISFDSSKYDITKYPNYRNGKRIAWGIKERKDVKDFRPGDLLTLPCGMGPKFYSVNDCKKNLEMLVKTKEALLRIYF